VAGVAGAADIAVIPVRSCRRPPCRVRDGLADCQRRAPTAGGRQFRRELGGPFLSPQV